MVSTNEYLGNIPIPKTGSRSVGLWLRLQVDLSIRTDEEKVQVVPGPTGVNNGAHAGGRTTIVVTIESDR
jgi:hypothetical protein